MSHLGTIDFLLSKNDIKMENDMGFDTDTELNISAGYENPDLMSSEFFDSIMTLDKNNLDGDLGSGLFENLELDVGLTSDGSFTYDEVQCETSTYSDSGLSSDQHEMTDQILSDEDLLKSILDHTVPTPLSTTEEKKIISQEIVSTNDYLNSTNVTNPIKLPQPVKYINIVKPIQKAKQVIRIQPISGNSRSVLLPINIKDLKTIKIINTNNLKAENVKFTTPPVRLNKKTDEKFVIQCPSEPEEDDTDDTFKQDIVMDDNGQYPLLVLTAEEKRLLSKDGIQLPCRYPLTKHEERELKRIRRKIRNKISAQDSRKRKKEYVDGLEERVKQCSEENRSLLKRIKLLQTQNSKLSTQLSKLQALVFKTGTSRAHPATCLMIVLLSVMLVTLPNLRHISNDKELNSLQQYVARRALLYSQQATNEDSLNVDEFITFPSKSKKVASASYAELASSLNEDDVIKVINSTKKNAGNLPEIGHSSKLHTHIPVDDQMNMDDYIIDKVKRPPKFDGKATRKRFIEPEIDEYWPPEKKKNTSLCTTHVNNCRIL